jgi:hypothetical protein
MWHPILQYGDDEGPRVVVNGAKMWHPIVLHGDDEGEMRGRYQVINSP